MASPRNSLVNGFGVLWSILVLVKTNDVLLSTEEVQAKFKEAGIVSDLITAAPKHAMEVVYNTTTVKFGNELSREEFETTPTKLGWPAEKGRYYTIIFTGGQAEIILGNSVEVCLHYIYTTLAWIWRDPIGGSGCLQWTKEEVIDYLTGTLERSFNPDVPKRSLPIDKEWQHWLVGNIPECDYLKGEVLSPYIGGLPYHLKYPHRYVFLVYLQPDPTPIKFDEPRLREKPVETERYHFNTGEFTEKYNLGIPIAGNFFVAGFDPDPTPTLPPILRGFLTTGGEQMQDNTTTPKTS